MLIGGPTDVVVEAEYSPRLAGDARGGPDPSAAGGGNAAASAPFAGKRQRPWPLRPEPMGPPRPAPRMEPDEQVNWSLPQHGEAPPRPARETLAAIAEEIAARPVPRNLEGTARPRPAEPRGEPRGEPRPEARAEPFGIGS